ncbi:hypothetical protein MYCTH_2296107, partial [Thermothelomyces thermophilus ATCC 42464]
MDGVGIDHHFHRQQQHHHRLNHGHFAAQQLPSKSPRKRKAEAPPENNERLSKRMSLLNLEQSGQKLYVPVENPDSQPPQPAPSKGSRRHNKHALQDDSQMQLDDTKYKVYIYNIDDELSSSDNEDGADEGKLVFLPDIDKHLRNTRIPTRVLNPGRPDESSSAGKELVLYQVPSSISIPEEQDSVRKAIMEARERARERQRLEREQERERQARAGGEVPAVPHAGGNISSSPVSGLTASDLTAEPLRARASGDAATPATLPSPVDADMFSGLQRAEDPDAMEL